MLQPNGLWSTLFAYNGRLRHLSASVGYWQWWFWGTGELLRVLRPPVSPVRRVLVHPVLG